jgi:Zn-dependent M28 family amino/carboxypeptidase
MKGILALIIFALAVFIVLRLSTFGWQYGSNLNMETKTKDNELTVRLKQHVYKLSHEIGDRSIFNYEKLKEAENYISQQFQSFGYSVELQEYALYGNRVRNIIATKLGHKKPQEIIILGAHYDTCFNPGADDNASAISGLLEVARFLYDKPTSRTIKFISFVNEEPPFFKSEDMGSRVYVREAKEKELDIKTVIILEMIGYYSDRPNSQRYPPILGMFYPNKANFIAVVGRFGLARLIREIVIDFKKATNFPIESVVTFGFITGVDFSDHWSFWKDGYPAVMITDTAFYRYPPYHTQSDTYEKLNYAGIREVTKGISSVLIELAK